LVTVSISCMYRDLKFGFAVPGLEVWLHVLFPVRIALFRRQYCLCVTAASSKILSAIDLVALLVLIIFVIQFLYAC
jgi:hypothetical protein